MIHDFKYIIKRVLIGVLIALILSFLNGKLFLIASAKQISSTWSPFTGSNGNIETVNNLDTVVNFTSNTNAWANWGYGYLRFNFSIIKTSGSSVAPLLVPQNVNVNNFVCDISSTSTSNSTFTGSTYSATCPMSMGSNGFQNIYIFFTPNQQNEQAIYRITIGQLLTFESVDEADYSSIINAINNNTSNDNSNTQSIIDSIDNSTQKIIDSNKVCQFIDSNNIVTNNYYLTSNGSLTSNSSWGITDYISLDSSTLEKLSTTGSTPHLCFYNLNKQLISCSSNSDLSIGLVTLPYNTYFFRASINISSNKPTYKVCKNGSQAITDATSNNTNAINEVNNTINNDNVDNASSSGGSFFNGFNVNSHGISGIITAPLRLLNSFTTSSCSPLTFQLPFIHNQITLPCMKGIYEQYFGVFFSLWQLITTGLIAYNVCINIYSKIHDLQNPNNDRIEVLNL